MKKIIKLTESDLTRIVERVIQEQSNLSNKGSLIDIAKKSKSVKSDAPTEYGWMLDPEHVWEVSSARGVKVGGVPNPVGKYFKSKDFIELTDTNGELGFVPKGVLNKIKKGIMSTMFAVKMGRNGIEIAAYWD